jgi:uncharacterized protein
MTYFLYKLISPRTTFPQDITNMEMNIMQKHVVYWKELTNKKIVLLFGPAADPKGSYGLAIVEAATEEVVQTGIICQKEKHSLSKFVHI